MESEQLTYVNVPGRWKPGDEMSAIGELVTHNGKPYVVVNAWRSLRSLRLALSPSLTLAEQIAAVAKRSAGARAEMVAATRNGGGRHGANHGR